MPTRKSGGESAGGLGVAGGGANLQTIILGAITIVLALINKMVPLRGNSKMRSRLIRGNLNSIMSIGNPELSGEKSLKCVETIDLLPFWGNEIVRYSSES